MFNFLKSKQVAKPTVINDTISIDEQIYKDVYSAQELLLAEAKEILSKPSGYDEERYERLQKMHSLGFSNAAEVKEFKEMDNKRKEQEAIKSKIEYYQQTYPLHKFISEEAVKTICKKYNLLLTMTSDYIAEIPEKNQKEIVAFRVMRKDVREPYEVYRGMFFMRHFHYPRFTEPKQYEDWQNEKLCGKDLLIVAPEHKLKTEGKIKDGHILKIKDPIVLQPVDKGYLIVSSWGLEAGDELVVNSINN
jgi:hypothetical protein